MSVRTEEKKTELKLLSFTLSEQSFIDETHRNSAEVT